MSYEHVYRFGRVPESVKRQEAMFEQLEFERAHDVMRLEDAQEAADFLLGKRPDYRGDTNWPVTSGYYVDKWLRERAANPDTPVHPYLGIWLRKDKSAGEEAIRQRASEEKAIAKAWGSVEAFREAVRQREAEQATAPNHATATRRTPEAPRPAAKPQP